MVSDDEAAAAFKAAAAYCGVRGDELGELGAFLSSMPENKRKYMPVDPSDYAATVKFVRTKGRECRLVAAFVPRRFRSTPPKPYCGRLRGCPLRPTSRIYVILCSHESCMIGDVPSSLVGVTVTINFLT